MKTILVPTDFSKTALNAINYAIEIAKLSKAKLVLFHVFHIPVIASEVPIVLPMDDIEKDCLKKLKKIEKDIRLKHGNKLVIESAYKLGFAVDEINQFAKEKKADLIIMGMQGGGYLYEKLVGSITTALIKRAKCPVLAIDKSVKFKSIKKIAFANDFQKINDKKILKFLKEFVELFNSHVYILNVAPELEMIPSAKEAAQGIKLERLLKTVDHTFHSIWNENITEGLKDFVNDKKMDMIVMIPRKHNVFWNIFHESNSKRMAFHTNVPLLALHE